MTLHFVRIFFLIIAMFVGYYIGTIMNNPSLGGMIGLGCGLALIGLEASMRRVSVRGLSSMVFGLLLGVLLAKLVSDILSLIPMGEQFHSLTRVILTLFFSYLGAVMALRGKDEFHLIIPYVRFQRQDLDERIALLDTSAIIDGRIVDIYKTSFLEDRLVIPRFVLHELQRLADSSDSIKHQRGRRGLDILRGMEHDSSMDIRIHEDDVDGEKEVDAKLVRLAKIMGARIFTTDYNLSRIATIQGVNILNIHELAGALKQVVFPGDEFDVKPVKEGREANQSIAYTAEGTMVVIQDGRSYIGKNVSVVVTSSLQTQAGRMIFARVKS